MKKTININLGGHPFIIDLDAYDSLERYLNSLKTYFKGHEGSEDILEDIELRIAELLHVELKITNIVSQKNVESIVSIMGTIAELGEDENLNANEDIANAATQTTGRRLFRRDDKKILAGVASGLAAYFGISNPWWIRLPFIIFTGAGSPLVYLIMWIFIPKAKTSSDRLAMQGEPININNIVKTIEDELTTLKDKIEDIGRDLTKKK